SAFSVRFRPPRVRAPTPHWIPAGIPPTPAAHHRPLESPQKDAALITVRDDPWAAAIFDVPTAAIGVVSLVVLWGLKPHGRSSSHPLGLARLAFWPVVRHGPVHSLGE